MIIVALGELKVRKSMGFGYLVGLVSGACDCLSLGCEFEPMLGVVYLKKKKSQGIGSKRNFTFL